MDVSDAMDGFSETVQLKRKSIGTRDSNGNWVDGTITTIDIQAVVQSLTADERLSLSEAVRTKETVKFHTTTLLKTADEEEQEDADIIVYQGSEWLISSIFNRLTNGNYIKAIGVKQ